MTLSCHDSRPGSIPGTRANFMLTTNERGRITEAKVLARLVELGKYVLIPFANVGRYDLLIDNRDGTFTRVECKTGRFKNGCVVFETASKGGYGYHPGKNYKNDVDLFGVWSSKTDKVYLIPVNQASNNEMWLRVDAPKQNHPTKTKWAKDFEI